MIKKTIICTIAIFLINLCLSANEGPLNGQWWCSVPESQRVGFIIGYTECSTFVVKDKVYPNLKWNLLAKQITDQYINNTTKQNQPIEDVMMGIYTKAQSIKTMDKYGSQFSFHPLKKGNGALDGRYWWESSQPERIGILYGYFQCLNKNTSTLRLFPHPIDWYVEKISQWYGINADDERLFDKKHIDDPIVNAIWRLREPIK